MYTWIKYNQCNAFAMYHLVFSGRRKSLSISVLFNIGSLDQIENLLYQKSKPYLESKQIYLKVNPHLANTIFVNPKYALFIGAIKQYFFAITKCIMYYCSFKFTIAIVITYRTRPLFHMLYRLFALSFVSESIRSYFTRKSRPLLSSNLKFSSQKLKTRKQDQLLKPVFRITKKNSLKYIFFELGAFL